MKLNEKNVMTVSIIVSVALFVIGVSEYINSRGYQMILDNRIRVMFTSLVFIIGSLFVLLLSMAICKTFLKED